MIRIAPAALLTVFTPALAAAHDVGLHHAHPHIDPVTIVLALGAVAALVAYIQWRRP